MKENQTRRIKAALKQSGRPRGATKNGNRNILAPIAGIAGIAGVPKPKLKPAESRRFRPPTAKERREIADTVDELLNLVFQRAPHIVLQAKLEKLHSQVHALRTR
jgi:hypothetical protein